MNSDSVTFCHKPTYDNLPTTCALSSGSPTACITQSSVSAGQVEQSPRSATSPLHLTSPMSVSDANQSPTVASDLNLMSASPPELCSSPPIFEPPPLPLTMNAPPLLMASQPLVGRQPLSSAIHLTPNTAVATSTLAGTVTGPVPSTFPSPGSAFTELHPRNGSVSQGRGYPFSTVPGEGQSPRSVAQPKPQPAKTSVPPVNTSSRGSSHSSSRSSAPSPIQYDALSSSASSAKSFACAVVDCRLCGQSHDPTTPHRYNYTQAVDADLCCSLCQQPLVDPLDTKCGHTFCTPCLKNHLAVQALCPVDRQIINYLECQQASNIVKRLLDKLPVSCPHTQYCKSVFCRASLEEHVRDWCPGTVVPCENAPHGCPYEGPRVTQDRHRCPFQKGPTALFQPIVVTPALERCPKGIPDPITAARSLPNSYPGTPQRFAQFVPRAAGSTNTEHGVPHPSMFFSSPSQLLSDRARPSAFKPKLPEIEETYDCPTIYAGSPVSVVIRRSANCCDLGFTFVGGVDTPLSCILIQEIYLDGSVALDGRLRPGDQILEVNGQLVIEATHAETRRLLTYNTPLVQLTVYRETVEASARRSALSHKQEEVFHVKLCKRQGKVLGIKLVGKKHLPGLYVLELVPGCEAELDGRLKKDDQILKINGIDLSDGTQEQAAHIINTATDWVVFKVSRRHRADTPDILRIANGSEEHMQLLSSPLRSLHLNSVNYTPSTSGSLVRGSVVEQNNRPESRSRQSNRSVRSPPISSHLMENTSLRALHDPSTSSPSSTSSFSSSTEPFTVSKSTSQLLVDEEDRESSTKEVTVTTCSVSPQFSDSIQAGPPITPQFFTPRTCPERSVVVNKAPDEPLGISVAGGRHSQRGDTPIYVTNINPNCILGRERLVKRGDVLLEVNGIGLVGLTHNEAVDVIRRASSMQSRVDLRLIDAPETEEGPDNFMPSWTFWLQLPPICQLARTVRLVRNVISSASSSSSSGGLEPLGFTIIGGLGDRVSSAPRYSPQSGTDTMASQTASPQRRNLGGYSSLYPYPIVIKSIVPGFLAARDGRLKCGDLILAVNNVSMLNISHASAVRLLKKLQGDVALQIISWPGTIV